MPVLQRIIKVLKYSTAQLNYSALFCDFCPSPVAMGKGSVATAATDRRTPLSDRNRRP